MLIPLLFSEQLNKTTYQIASSLSHFLATNIAICMAIRTSRNRKSRGIESSTLLASNGNEGIFVRHNYRIIMLDEKNDLCIGMKQILLQAILLISLPSFFRRWWSLFTKLFISAITLSILPGATSSNASLS